MYICPGCRSYFKTGSPGRKIKCLRCKEEYLTDLKITDEEWRKLDQDARQSRIGRAIAGEQLREEIPVENTPSPAVALSDTAKQAESGEDNEPKGVKNKEDLPDEVILEAKHILEQQDMQAEMPKQPVDKRRLAIVCSVGGGLLVLLTFLSLVVPIFRMKGEAAALATVQAGDVVSFGKYKGNTEWTVLELDDDGITMVSNYYVASAIPKDLKDQVNQIEWLNSSFMNRAFNLYERRKLIITDDEFNNYIHIMGSDEWSKYADVIEFQDDGKVHPVCRISTSGL